MPSRRRRWLGCALATVLLLLVTALFALVMTGDRNVIVGHLARAGAALGASQARRAVADLDVVDGKLRDDQQGARLQWPHTTPATTLRGYRMIAAGLRANARLALGELDAASAALERRRALAVERLNATGIDEHLRGAVHRSARALAHGRRAAPRRPAAAWLRHRSPRRCRRRQARCRARSGVPR